MYIAPHQQEKARSKTLSADFISHCVALNLYLLQFVFSYFSLNVVQMCIALFAKKLFLATGKVLYFDRLQISLCLIVS